MNDTAEQSAIEAKAREMHLSVDEYLSALTRHAYVFENSTMSMGTNLTEDYQHVRNLIDQLLASGEWLSIHSYKPLGKISPQWNLPSHTKSIEAIVQFCHIVEHMQAYVSRDASHDNYTVLRLHTIFDDMEYKRRLYGTSISQNGLNWKALGYPVPAGLLFRVRDALIAEGLFVAHYIQANLHHILQQDQPYTIEKVGYLA